MTYPLTFTTDNLPTGVNGRAKGPVILIHKGWEGNEGLYQHEKTHVLQWFCTLGLHPLLYKFHKPYRLWAEARAYAEQMKYPNGKGGYLSLDLAAFRLALPRYDLGITIERAKLEIERRIT